MSSNDMTFIKGYVDKRYTFDMSFDQLGGLVNAAKEEYRKNLIAMIKRLARIKSDAQKQVPEWRLDHHYETKLKKYDQE